MHTHFRFIFNLHAGKDSTTELFETLCDEQNHSRLSHTAQDSKYITNNQYVECNNVITSIIMKVNLIFYYLRTHHFVL